MNAIDGLGCFFNGLCILQIWFHTLSVREGDKNYDVIFFFPL